MNKLIIFSMLALVLLSACNQSQSIDEKDERIRQLEEKIAVYEQDQADDFSSEDANFIVEKAKKFNKKSGAWITPAMAKSKINAYKNHIGRDPKDTTRIKKGNAYAFSFGLDKVDSLMNETKRINKIKSDSIIGIRVYLNWVKRNAKSGPDVLLVPITSDFKNLYPIDNGFDPKMEAYEKYFILNSSVPCPFECDPD